MSLCQHGQCKFNFGIQYAYRKSILPRPQYNGQVLSQTVTLTLVTWEFLKFITSIWDENMWVKFEYDILWCENLNCDRVTPILENLNITLQQSWIIKPYMQIWSWDSSGFWARLVKTRVRHRPHWHISGSAKHRTSAGVLANCRTCLYICWPLLDTHLEVWWCIHCNSCFIFLQCESWLSFIAA